MILPGLSPGCPDSPGRTADARRFMAQVQRDYFTTMRDALRKYGLRAPLLAVGDTADPADLYATATELDAVGCNWYFSHPDFPGVIGCRRLTSRCPTHWAARRRTAFCGALAARGSGAAR